MGDSDDQDALRHHTVEDAVGVTPQGIEAVPLVTRRPTLGSLADGTQRDLNGRLEARRSLGAAPLIPGQRLLIVGIGRRQEDDLSHGRATPAEPAP